MFGLGLPEFLIILVIILLLFGAKRLPEIGEGLGKTVRELKKLKGDPRPDQKKASEPRKETVLPDLKKEVEEIPGMKEAKELKEAASQVKNLTKFFK